MNSRRKWKKQFATKPDTPQLDEAQIPSDMEPVVKALLQRQQMQAREEGDRFAWEATPQGIQTYLNGEPDTLWRVEQKEAAPRRPGPEEIIRRLREMEAEQQRKGHDFTWDVRDDGIYLTLDGKPLDIIRPDEVGPSNMTLLNNQMRCPECHMKANAVSSIDGPEAPEEGCVIVCAQCTAVNVMTGYGGLRPITKEELDELPEDFRTQLGRHLREMRVRQAAGEDLTQGFEPGLIQYEDQ